MTSAILKHSVRVRVRVCVYVCVCARVSMCVRERERERARKRQRERGCVYVRMLICIHRLCERMNECERKGGREKEKGSGRQGAGDRQGEREGGREKESAPGAWSLWYRPRVSPTGVSQDHPPRRRGWMSQRPFLIYRQSIEKHSIRNRQFLSCAQGYSCCYTVRMAVG